MNTKGPIPLTEIFTHDSLMGTRVARRGQRLFLQRVPNFAPFCFTCVKTASSAALKTSRQLIGAKVFGRAADYDLSDDNIVRVEARELRKRLEAYFANEGNPSRWSLKFPKAPTYRFFRPRNIRPLRLKDRNPRGKKKRQSGRHPARRASNPGGSGW